MDTPPIAPSVAPTINYRDAHAAIKWLTEVLGFEVTGSSRNPMAALHTLNWFGATAL